MSSILKALKKLEVEKSARTPETLKIDTEILRGGGSSRFPYRTITLLAILFFVCGSAATYLYVKRGTHPADKAASSSSSPAVQLPQAAMEVSPKAMPAETNVPLRSVQVELPRSQTKNAPSGRSDTTAPHIMKHSNRTRTAAPVTNGQTKQGAVATPSVPPPAAKRIPTLRVDGIAYHFGSADSLAVVNGATVYVGAIIDGARVEGIEKDRIRFSYDGGRFEVPLGNSN